MKRCSKCRQRKPKTAFCRKAMAADGLASRCRECMAEIQWKIRYGLTRQQYEALLTEQGKVCAICRQPEQRYRYLSVDHDHETGEIRGLLCSNCNPMVGYARNNPQVLRDAASYLERKAVVSC